MYVWGLKKQFYQNNDSLKMFLEYIIDMHLSFKILVVLFVSQRFIFYFCQTFEHSVQI